MNPILLAVLLATAPFSSEQPVSKLPPNGSAGCPFQVNFPDGGPAFQVDCDFSVNWNKFDPDNIWGVSPGGAGTFNGVSTFVSYPDGGSQHSDSNLGSVDITPTENGGFNSLAINMDFGGRVSFDRTRSTFLELYGRGNTIFSPAGFESDGGLTARSVCLNDGTTCLASGAGGLSVINSSTPAKFTSPIVLCADMVTNAGTGKADGGFKFEDGGAVTCATTPECSFGLHTIGGSFADHGFECDWNTTQWNCATSGSFNANICCYCAQ